MKTTFVRLLILLLLLIPIDTWAQGKSLKVACLGNSITYGASIPNREQNSYPAQLQAYLGDTYEVKNFGVSGSTLLSKGDYPYISMQEFANAKAFLPQIVLIKLGTNDTKPQNWKYKDEFLKDYQNLIDSIKTWQSHPRIILLTPVQCFLTEENTINPRLISDSVRPMIEELAWKNKLEIINLHNLFDKQWDASLFPDRLHPSSIGAGIMAQKIGNYLQATLPASHPLDYVFLKHAQPFNFHGFQGYEFTYEGMSCKIVRPYTECKGKPWVIRARFWGHEPQTDIALLEQGFHIAYCDVADLYGSNQAVARWNKFYTLLTANGLNPKVALEGMSRGGLIVYNWAAQNPEKVACIYADAPVMDLKSWPMGEGLYEGSAEDIQKMLQAYGFSNKQEALAWNHNPVNHASQIANAQIPCLHVVGDADSIVPVAENTALFEQAMKELGHPITVIHKPGIGHHPHSLNNPKPIVDFILSAYGLHENECTHAVPGNEYRPAAGWTEGSEWHSVAEDIKATLKGKKLKLLLLGNSITQGWGGNRKAVTYKPGKTVMDLALGKDVWESAGISGDRTQNLLWRIQHDNYNCCKPENVIIAIGINNLISGNNSPEDTAEGIIAITKEAEKKFPDSHIIVLGLLPSGKKAQSDIRLRCNRIHQILKSYTFDKALYIDPTQWFTDGNGDIKEGLYANDYIHLTDKGYQVMATQIKPLLR